MSRLIPLTRMAPPPFLTTMETFCAYIAGKVSLRMRNMWSFMSYLGRAQGPPWASQVALVVKNPPAIAGDVRLRFDPWVWKIL